MNKKLKAAHSHFTAERDKLLAELDILLNGQSNPDCLCRVFNTFREMAIVNVAIGNIESIMADNSEPESPQGMNMDQLEEMARMADAIRQINGQAKNQNNENNDA